jgi:peptide/nickel transport system substrate-binding protein
MKKPFPPIHSLFILLTLTALLLTACGASGDTDRAAATDAPTANEAPAATQGGQPVADMSIVKDIQLDPANATDADSLFVIGYIYEGLVTLGADGIAPGLAESWTVSDDGLDYIFTLRQNVTFHDSTPFNADAVIANFTRWFDPKDPAHDTGEYAAWASIFGGFKGETGEGNVPKSNFDGAEKVDDYTVLIHLTKPDDNFLAKLVNPAFDMVSPAAFGADYFGTSLGTAAGTGPYKLTAWSDSALTLEPFAAYRNGAPADKLEFPFK